MAMTKIERVIPLLVYEDIPAAHDFLVGAFGFTPGRVDLDQEGHAVHGELRVGDLEIWLHRATGEHKMSAHSAMPATSSGFVVYVDDVDAHYKQARAFGAIAESEPADMEYGQREYGVRDLEGHRWWFATPLKEVNVLNHATNT
jgi:uncharacterized glyoxalase superfamily protein PhnB